MEKNCLVTNLMCSCVSGCVYACVAVPCRNRRLFRCIFRAHCCVWSTVSLNFHYGRRSYVQRRCMDIYKAHMSPALNGSSAIRLKYVTNNLRFLHRTATCANALLLCKSASITCAKFPMTWEIVYGVMFGLASVSWQYHTSHCKLVAMTVIAMTVVVMTVYGCHLHTSVYLGIIVVIKLHDHNPLHWDVVKNGCWHDVRFTCLVYFLSRWGHSAVIVKYFMEHMSAAWSDGKGWTLLHYACRWVSFLRVCPS